MTTAPQLPGLVPTLRSLPGPGEPVVAPFPGKLEGKTFVRRSAVHDAGATRAVYVHGMGGNSNNWIDLMYLLEPIFPGVALDLPGYGFSDPSDDGKYSIGRNAKAVVEVIEREGGKPVHLFGNSLGGVTAVAVAARRPDLVKTLNLMSPAMLTRAVMVKEHAPKAWTILSSRRKSKKIPIEELAQQLATDVRSLCFADPSRLSDQRFNDSITESARRLSLAYNQDVATASARALFDAAAIKNGRSIWEIARTVDTPTLAIYGVQDKLVPVELAPRAAAVLRNSQVTIWPDSGHVAQMEHPVRTAQLFLQWVATVAADGALGRPA